MTAIDEELISRIEEQVVETYRARLDQMRTVLNETGIRRARAAMLEAPTVLANALAHEVTARQQVRAAKEQAEQAVAEAEYLVVRPFEQDGNKTWLLDANGERSRTVLADEQKSIVGGLVRQHPSVVAARKRLQEAENTAAMAAADVEVAKANLSVSKHDTDAAAAELLLAAAINKDGNR